MSSRHKTTATYLLPCRLQNITIMKNDITTRHDSFAEQCTEQSASFCQLRHQQTEILPIAKLLPNKYRVAQKNVYTLYSSISLK